MEHPEHNPGEPEFGDHDEDAAHNPGEFQFGSEDEPTEPADEDDEG
jgi:hypothetical protein